MKRAAILVTVLAIAGIAASAATAGRECNGLKACVSVAGPWVIAATPQRVEYQLACPKGFIVGGLDADLAERGVDVGFVGGLGSPVNPGVTTSTSAVFLGRLIAGTNPAASFRPRIGCIPASGGGQRVPTAVRPRSAVESAQFTVAPGTHRYATECSHGRLASYSHALGFYGATPPTVAQVRAVHATFARVGARVRVSVSSSVAAVVQVVLVCAS